MKGKHKTGHWKDGYKNQMKTKISDERCVQVYLGKRDLLAAWEEKLEPDHPYIKTLKKKVHIAKSHMVHKGLI